MAMLMRMRRSRGMASGVLLMLLGIWGGLIAFIGPYFHFAYTPAASWTYTTARLWLEILPGAAVLLGGLLLAVTAARHLALFGGLLAAAAGAWFALGTVLSPIWNHGVALGGTPTGATASLRVGEQLAFYTGLGVVVVFIASVAIGRVLSLPAEVAPAVIEPAPVESAPIG
jgi:hypothetical protein